MSERPIEVLLHHMPSVAGRAENEWAQGFAKSVLRQSRRARWQPSPKQLGIMQRLVSELLREEDGDLVVVED